MQVRVVQEVMERCNHGSLRDTFQIVRHKTNRQEHIGQDASDDGKLLFLP
jgi:hypothetical protein